MAQTAHSAPAHADGVVPLPPLRVGFVGFGEVNSPRDLIERKVDGARRALEGLGLQLVTTAPVSDDAAGIDESVPGLTWPGRTSTCWWSA